MFFFFKQKTAYDLCIRDWSSDVALPIFAGFARGHTGRRAGEFSIAALAALGDFFTANNTVAILVGGGLAKDIAVRHGISPKRSASLLDIFACVVQGVLPYGRSEEHTSELQSLMRISYAVFCLTKKNK